MGYGRYAPTYIGYDIDFLYVGEGMNSSMAVSELRDGTRNYHNAGKVQASSEPQDMRLQRMLGHLTTLIPTQARSVLVIGCGAGVTAGASKLLYTTASRSYRATGGGRQKLSPDEIQTSIEGSLRRLRTDYLDIFLLHSPKAEVIANGSVFERLSRLQDKGLIRQFGVSCGSVDTPEVSASIANAAMGIPGLGALQIPVTAARTELAPVLPAASEKGIATLVREPFAQERIFDDQALMKALSGNGTRKATHGALRFVAQLPSDYLWFVLIAANALSRA